MDLRHITETYAVAPQITAEDASGLAAAGFTHVICNRPDAEVTPDLQADTIRAAVEAAGMIFALNPVTHAGMTPENIDQQQAIMAKDGAKILAYCRSGTRSTFLWGLACAETQTPADILAAAAQAGYDLSPLQPYLEAKAQTKSGQ